MKICLLGASGSIGTQTIDVIDKNPHHFSLVAFSVGYNHKVIKPILSTHKDVKYVYLIDKEECAKYQKEFPSVKFLCDDHDLENIITFSNPDMVVNALVGFAGLLPSIRTLEENKKLALANKESLVVGGELINKLLAEGHGQLYPIDSEHSALWKCLKVDSDNVNKLIITASGGAFRNLSREQLQSVTKEDALNHPTWKMGNKITIDCATMINKAFEVIEAYYLFGYGYDKVEVKLHDESMLHSAVLYEDGLYRGEINKPDMRNPIKFAIFEGNIEFETSTFNSFDDLNKLHFHDFNIERYPMVKLAEIVSNKKGNSGAVINSANEVAVRAFLNDEISFLDIENIVFSTLEKVPYSSVEKVDDLIKWHLYAEDVAKELVKEANKK